MADTSIYRMLQTGPVPAIDTPQDVEARRLKLSQMGQQGQLNAQNLQLGAQRQQLNEQGMQENALTLRGMELKQSTDQETLGRARKVREILATAPDEATALSEVGKVDPNAKMALEKHFGERRRATQEETARKFDYETKRSNHMIESLEALAGEEDPERFLAGYKVQRNRLIATGLYKPEEIPEVATREEIMGQLSPEAQQKLRELVPLPKDLAEESGLEPGTKVSIVRLNALRDSQTKRLNAESLAEQRRNPKPDTLSETTRHNKAMEGVARERNDIARNRPPTGAAGQPTPAQKQQRYEEIEREEYGSSGKPGLHDTLDALGRILKQGWELDAKGNKIKLTDSEDKQVMSRREQIQDKIDNLTVHRDAILKEKEALGKTTAADIAPREYGKKAAAPAPAGPKYNAAAPTAPKKAATAPPAEILAKVPEGKAFTGPDGTQWKKVNGKAVRL